MFIVLDGPDGAGKSTQIDCLEEHFKAAGKMVCRVREPGATPVGEGIRKVLLRTDFEMSALTECFLFNAARSQLVQDVIRPALERGEVVLADRFWPSTVVYQGLAGGLDRQRARDLCLAAVDGTEPDHIILIDVPLEITEARLGRHRDRMEDKGRDFLGRVRDGFSQLSREEKWPVVDGTRPAEQVSADIAALLELT